MPEYEVNLTRDVAQYVVVYLTADSQEEAEEIARKKAREDHSLEWEDGMPDGVDVMDINEIP